VEEIMLGRSKPLVAYFGALALAVTLAACQTMMTPQKPLYDRLGGKPAISAVVDDFVGNVAADSRINGFFARTDVPNLKRLLVEQICQASGGPCTYTGRDMATTHRGMNVTDAQFNALVEDLVKTLDKFNVPQREKGELLAALGSLKPQIVGK
jgi:hemoglobin